MTKLNHCRFLSLVLALAMVFTASCNVKNSDKDSLEDTSDVIPNLHPIDGADNVTVRVNRNDNVSYFDVNLANIEAKAGIENRRYFGWCANWDAPIDMDRDYDGITLYTSRTDRNWNKLNYFLNKREHYSQTIDGAGYKEMQSVVWALIEFNEFDIDRDRVLSNVNKEAYQAMLNDVQENGDGFEHTDVTIHALVADMSIHETDGKTTQTVIIEDTN